MPNLTAILTADVDGYSRPVEVDEAGVIARQKAHRAELIDQSIADRHRRRSRPQAMGCWSSLPVPLLLATTASGALYNHAPRSILLTRNRVTALMLKKSVHPGNALLT
jgi:class 3 adenylate cyclase